MAKVTVDIPKPVPSIVTLELSAEEAQVLRDIVGYGVVGYGDQFNLVSNIFFAMDNAGLKASGIIKFNGQLHFGG